MKTYILDRYKKIEEEWEEFSPVPLLFGSFIILGLYSFLIAIAKPHPLIVWFDIAICFIVTIFIMERFVFEQGYEENDRFATTGDILFNKFIGFLTGLNYAIMFYIRPLLIFILLLVIYEIFKEYFKGAILFVTIIWAIIMIIAGAIEFNKKLYFEGSIVKEREREKERKRKEREKKKVDRNFFPKKKRGSKK